MTSITVPVRATVRADARRLSVDPAAVGMWLAVFAAILYLALRGGGYDVLVRGPAGIALWWSIAVAVALGVLPAIPRGRRARFAAGLFALFAIWTAISVTASEDPERSWLEVGRVVTYLGVLLVALGLPWRRYGRYAIDGLAAAIALICALALLSRMQPGWFPHNDVVQFLPNTRQRLAYPINYWNGLAALAAIGLPLLLNRATTALTVAGRAAAAGALPLLACTIYLAVSRGGALAGALGLVAYLALCRDRPARAATLIVAGTGSALLIAAAGQRSALRDGLVSAVARREGHELIAVALVVCGGVALLQAALALAARYGWRPAWTQVRRRPASVLTTTAAILAAGAFLALGGPHALSKSWHQFKSPVVAQNATASRFASTSGNGRYQYWRSTTKVAAVTSGTGPGTFELYWDRAGTLPGFVRNAHSLFFETVGETGLIGLAVLLGFFLAVLAAGAAAALRSRKRRNGLAAATGAALAFTVSATVDWVWQLPVLPIAFMILAGYVLSQHERHRAPARRPRTALRVGGAVIALALAAVVTVPVATVADVRSSQRDARSGDLIGALRAARTAERLSPHAESPRLQEALVLEQLGDLRGALTAANRAAGASRADWRPWLVIARLDARLGDAPAALAAFRHGRSLDPRSPIFARAP